MFMFVLFHNYDLLNFAHTIIIYKTLNIHFKIYIWCCLLKYQHYQHLRPPPSVMSLTNRYVLTIPVVRLFCFYHIYPSDVLTFKLFNQILWTTPSVLSVLRHPIIAVTILYIVYQYAVRYNKITRLCLPSVYSFGYQLCCGYGYG